MWISKLWKKISWVLKTWNESPSREAVQRRNGKNGIANAEYYVLAFNTCHAELNHWPLGNFNKILVIFKRILVIDSLQNKIQNLPDESTILPKFIYDIW